MASPMARWSPLASSTHRRRREHDGACRQGGDSDPAHDVKLPPELQALKQAAEQRLAEWQASGRGLGASSLADVVVFCSSGLGDAGRHDIEIELFVTGGNEEGLRTILNLDTARF